VNPVRLIRSRALKIPIDNIDTDQIIPARFLKVTGREGLGRWLFSNWRYDPDGAPRPDFVLNREEAQGACILVAGDNFGCGSSREHAPWALLDFGFRAVVSTGIASIFRNNALKNGLLPVVVPRAIHRKLLDEDGEVSIDLETLTLTLPDGTRTSFPIDPFARRCLLDGVDELGFILEAEEAIAAFETRAGRGPRGTSS
jgi:3-isopropylmalate/(R)-2-methylmalate dehydratase small subunit